jgi:hypothetical protein
MKVSQARVIFGLGAFGTIAACEQINASGGAAPSRDAPVSSEAGSSEAAAAQLDSDASRDAGTAETGAEIRAPDSGESARGAAAPALDGSAGYYDYDTVDQFLPKYVAVVKNVKAKYPAVKHTDVMPWAAFLQLDCT